MVDRSGGYETTPDRVRLADLVRFTEDVQVLLRGDTREVDTQNLDVAIKQGSLAIETEAIHAPKLFSDLQLLGSVQIMDQRIDGKRRDIIQKWQKLTASFKSMHFRISAYFLAAPIVISSESDFRNNDADQWVQVERYIRGEIEDLGGSVKPNAHVRLSDGTTLTVATDKSVLREDTLNRLYKTEMLRVRADYNVLTRELRNARLISFVEYSNKIDEADFKRMTQRGREAWKDVENATAWVDELRGGIH